MNCRHSNELFISKQDLLIKNNFMSIHDYHQRELEPRKLSQEQVEDPQQVLDELFDYAHLLQWREALWEWLKVAVSGNYKKESRRDRSNLLYFYEKVEMLVEAAHIIHQQKANNIQT